MKFPIDARLKDCSLVRLSLADHSHVEPLRRLFGVIVDEGSSYPHECLPNDEDFCAYWFQGSSTVVTHAGGAHVEDVIVGAFYLRPNWPGRARQVANAGFIVAPEWRNRGLGWLLGATMLQYAKESGYRHVLFNLVFVENAAARHLWRKLGFSELAILPRTVRKNDGGYQDSIIMFRSLVPVVTANSEVERETAVNRSTQREEP